ncbi:signal-induced proliferation-associated 1-like protein 3 isoform X2 [Esox lucius]|uniref:signal-induced proliferation-associated 1-like protein 3 isoform X2 n=1 Tax=Esox lucius TaxID=8010 RepID=UPI0014777D16|nr:signal-induced proliferation-associated 1-like protein 3 isoform X2 [Esox lucius]
MASCSPAHKGWFGERGVHQGVGLDVLFSGRDFDTPEHLYSPNETQQCQQAKSHYASPRTPPRPLNIWGTYSPPPQRPGPRPAPLNQCHGYHAHTLPLPRRALAVFKPWWVKQRGNHREGGTHCSPQGYKTHTLEKPCMLRATITSSSSDSNHPVQDQSQDFQEQSKLSQQHFNKQQQMPSLSPETAHQPIFSNKTAYQPSHSPKTAYQPSHSPKTAYQPSHSPKTAYQPSHSPKTAHQPSFSPKTVHQPSFSPKTVYQPSHSPKTTHQPSFSPNTVYQPSHSPKTAHQPSFSPKTVHQPSFSPKTVHQPSFSPNTVYQSSHSPKTAHQPSFSPNTVYQSSHSPKTAHQPSFSPKTVYRSLTTWEHKVNTITDNNTTEINNSTHCNNIKRQVDMTSQNVFGQPRVMAALRSPHSPRQTHTDRNIEEALRRLIVLDNTSEDSRTDASCRQSLSTEISLDKCPSDFSQPCSPVSDCPELEGLGDLSASEQSLTEGWNPGHSPPPEPGWSLDWSNPVNASNAYEGQRAVEPVSPSKPQRHGSDSGPASHYLQGYSVQPILTIPECSDLADRLHHLEELLRRLEGNLDKERQDKVALMEEVTILRETNQRLWEESLSSNEQLRKLSVLFNVAPGMMPRERENDQQY